MLMLLIAAVLGPSNAYAHGGGEPRLTNVAAGPYRLYLWSSPEPPRVGEIHFTVAVTEPNADAPVSDDDQSLEAAILDAEVQIALKPVDQDVEPILVSATHQEAVFEMFYEADTVLPTAGKWRATVTVIGPEGQGSAPFELDLLPARIVNWTLVIGLGMGLLAIIGLSRLGRRDKRVGKRTGATRKA